MKFKKWILPAAFITMALGTMSCDTSTEQKAENVETAEKDLAVAEAELENARKDSAAEYERFRKDADAVLMANEQKMADLKSTMTTKKSDIRIQYEKDLEKLRLENEKLKSDLKNFTYGTNENWETFKAGVNRDIDRIGRSISALAEKDN
ncbi:MAG TPA: hypothetical protein VK907_03815 [Phnomibacter sp.]|nr:hypothetical protein [Phnomibacter sp.]